MEIKFFQVEKVDEGLRLDRWFYRNIPSMPFTVVAKWIRKGQVRVDGKRVKISSRINFNQKIRTPVIEFEKQQAKLIPRNFDSIKEKILKSVIFEDEYLIALNKPYGLCVQGGTKVKISIDSIFKLANIEAKIVHRIDKETTGILLLAKNAYIAAEISKLIRGRKITKTYLTILCGVPNKTKGIIESIIKKGEAELLKEQYACTKFRILAKYKRMLSLVEMIPLTGRKHQIRIHCKEIGCPILGDSKYRYSNGNGTTHKQNRLHLHAYSLDFKLFGKEYNLKVELPSHFLDTIKRYSEIKKFSYSASLLSYTNHQK